MVRESKAAQGLTREVVLGALVVAAWAVSQGVARADDGEARPLSTAITSNDACLAAQALTEHIRTWSGRDRVVARVEVVVEAESERARFRVLRDGTPIAERTFRRLPRVCERRLAIVGVSLALALDSTLLSAIEAPVSVLPPETASPEEPLAPVVDRRDAPTVVAPRPSSMSFEVDVGFGVGHGLLGETSVGVESAASVAWSHVFVTRVIVGADSARRWDFAGASIDGTSARFAIDACLRAWPTTSTFAMACAGPSAGVAQLEGVGFSESRRARVTAFGVRSDLDVAGYVVGALRVGVRGSLVWTPAPAELRALNSRLETSASETLPAVGVALLVTLGARLGVPTETER